MVSKAIYTVVAVAGIAAAGSAALWCQRQASGTSAASLAATSAPSATGASAQVPSATASSPGKPPTVEIATVEIASLSDDTRAVGSLRSRQGIVLRPEISGRITRLNFIDGQRVHKGQVLVQLDDQLQQAQILQSQAELSIAQANEKRNRDLVAQNFISQRSLDESAANSQVAQAKLVLARATAARLKIIAPFDGIVGIRQANVGDYLKDGADIVNLEDIDAVYIDFRLPERFQSKIKRGQSALVDIDALPGKPYTALVQAIDPLIDAGGRSVGIRGCIDNRALQLRPGMFARVTPVFGVRESASVIPEEAVLPQGGKQFVLKLLPGPSESTRITQRVEVKLGLRSPGKVEVVQGLEPGDTVVRTGQQRVQKDATVVAVVDLASASRGSTDKAAAVPVSVPARPAVAVSSAPAASSASVATSASSTSPASPISPASSTAALTPRPGPNPCGELPPGGTAKATKSPASSPRLAG